MKKTLISLASGVSFALPFLVLAESRAKFGYFESIFIEGSGLLSNILVFLIALAVVWFIWNVVRYSMSEDEEGKGKAKSQMIWGVVAIAVIVSVWGVVGLLRNAFGVESNSGASGYNFDTFIPGGSSNTRVPDGTRMEDYQNLP